MSSGPVGAAPEADPVAIAEYWAEVALASSLIVDAVAVTSNVG
jgi:hypothetical protein